MTIPEIVQAMKTECPAGYFTSAEEMETLLQAVAQYVEETSSLLHEDAQCDHSVGICWCGYWHTYNNLQFQVKGILGKLRICTACNSKFDPDHKEFSVRGFEHLCDSCSYDRHFNETHYDPTADFQRQDEILHGLGDFDGS